MGAPQKNTQSDPKQEKSERISQGEKKTEGGKKSGNIRETSIFSIFKKNAPPENEISLANQKLFPGEKFEGKCRNDQIFSRKKST